jgi:hypothetical protein
MKDMQLICESGGYHTMVIVSRDVQTGVFNFGSVSVDHQFFTGGFDSVSVSFKKAIRFSFIAH